MSMFWRRLLDDRRLDLFLATVLVGAIAVESWLHRGVADRHWLVTALAGVVFGAPIAVRRVTPGLALVSSLAVAAIQTPLGGDLPSGAINGQVTPVIVLVVLAYSTGIGLAAARASAALVLALALLVLAAFLPGATTPSGLGNTAASVFYGSLMIIPAWFVGRVAREHALRSAVSRQLAHRIAAEQQQQQAAVVADERVRIGSELQDIIAHSVSAMIVQAGSARMLLRTQPGRAHDSIVNVEETGRDALADLRRLLGVLRKDDDPRALSPQPGLGQLGNLTASLAGAGLSCGLRVEGEQIDLTPGIDLVAYRLIEAVLQAAAADRVGHGEVAVRYEPHELTLEVRGNSAISDLGVKLTAVAERLALYDGGLHTQEWNDGFAVRARLPLELAVPS